ncbi:OB-fold protein [Yeosuana marina]|uniref:OB-fold protein n=1 Tax=Yeosuana marina TaxID=1565536 RepID=UPI00142317CE|nr:hypothetical protein [Yeosuana marina]
MSRKKTVIVSVLAIIMLGIFLAVKEYNKPHINVADTKPDIITNSQGLLEDFQVNENSANKKYLDQIVQVSGRISKLEASENNDIIITLLNDKSPLGTVICHLSPDENKKLINLKEGQDIIAKGICTGYLMDVILVRCVLVKI